MLYLDKIELQLRIMKIHPINFKIDHNEIILRSPELSEAGLLLTYFQNLFHESSIFMQHESNFYDDKIVADQERFLNLFNGSDKSFVIAAFLGPEIVGHIIVDSFGFTRTGHRAKLVMGVLNKMQHQGLGSQLLKLAIEQSEATNTHSLELQVKSFNAPAIRLYDKFDFERIGSIPAAACIDGEYSDEHIYQRLSLSLKSILESQRSSSHAPRVKSGFF